MLPKGGTVRSHMLMFCLILTPALALADGPADAKAALHKLQGREAVQVHLDYQSWRQSGAEGKLEKPNQAQVGVRVAEDATMLRVEWDTSLVEKVEEEARRHDVDPTSPTSLRESLKDLDPGRLHHFLNQGPVLANLLAESRFLRESPENHGGKAARLLVFAFEPRVPASRQSHLSKREGEFKLWIDGEGIPFEAESTIHYQGKMSRIFGAFEVRTRTTTQFERIGTRLLVRSRTIEDEASDSGFVTRSKTLVSLKQVMP